MGPARDGDALAPDGVASTPTTSGLATHAGYDWDLVTDEIRWGASLAEVIGLDDERLTTGLGWAENLVAESPSSRYEAVMAGGFDTGGGVAFRAVYGLRPARRSDAAPIWIEDKGRWFADAADRPVRVQGSIRRTVDPFDADIARAAGLLDPATGAFTRARFVNHVSRHLRLAGAKTSTFAVLTIGIERESGGLADEVGVTEAFSRLRPEMRVNEAVAREDATRFAALLESCNAEQAAAAAHRFIAAIERGGPPGLRARVGAVLAPTHSRAPEALLGMANEALAAASDVNPFVLHDREATRTAVAPRDDLLSALNQGRVVLALRPVVAAKSVAAGPRHIVFQEGLVRVVTSDGRLMPADDLVREAAEDGLAMLLERRVLELAVGMLAADRKLKLSIDVSLAALGENAWLEHLRATARLRPDVARRLTLEVAEAHAVADIEATCAALAAVRPCGVKLALDGFGPARLPFRVLRRLAADFLRIDRALTQAVGTDAVDRSLRDLVDLARNLAIPTIAQGVAGEAEARALARLGIDHLEGELFAQPELEPNPQMPARARA